LLLDPHIALGSYLVAFDDVLVGYLLAVLRVHALLRDAHAGLAGELVKAHRLAVDGAVELHRYGHQPEADRTGPDRAGHMTVLPRIGGLPARSEALRPWQDGRGVG